MPSEKDKLIKKAETFLNEKLVTGDMIKESRAKLVKAIEDNWPLFFCDTQNAAILIDRQRLVIKQLLERLEAAEQERQEWRPISEAPKDGTQILTVVKGFTPTIAWFDGKEWVNPFLLISRLKWDVCQDEMVSIDEDGYVPTLGMPLPNPPIEEK